MVSYLSLSSCQVLFTQYQYLKSVGEGLSKADYKLLCHILVSTISVYRQIQENDKGWLKITKRFIQDKFRNADPVRLQRHGLIDIDRRYIAGKRPRGYRLKDWVLDGYVQASHSNAPDKRYVNIVTGKPQQPNQPEPLNDPPIPTLIQLSIERLKVCYFDRPAVLEHLKQLHATYVQTPTQSNRFRYLNDWFIFDTIDKSAEPTDKLGIFKFTPSYRMQATGRIGTSLQSASRAMKRAAYGSIDGIHNYDLSSSQMALLLQQLELYRIPCPWLAEYLNGPSKRDDYARLVGISIPAWKKCLYSILMTGHIPTNTKWRDTPVVDALKEEIDDPVELTAVLGRLRSVLKPLTQPLKLWHRIINAQAKLEGKVSNMFGIDRPTPEFNNTAAMVAHILQGSEAYFIHILTVISGKYGFEPIGNEHDGLITIGKIPDDAIREAQSLTQLYCLELREKPF